MSCSVTERVPETRPGGTGGGCRLRGSPSSISAPPGSKTSAAGGGSTAGIVGAGSTSAVAASASAAGGGGGGLRQKPCCLCWCCCCSCSCSTPGKGNEENGQGKNSNADLLTCDGEPTPSLDVIRSWGRSFDKLMKSAAGRKVFREFLRCEYSEENILFWQACEDLKKENNPEIIEEKVHSIYEDYISTLSAKEVSLDSRVREIVNRNMKEPTTRTFDEAQLQIYTLMHRDSYPRFVNSPLYKNLAQITATDVQKKKRQHSQSEGSHG